MTLPGTDLPPRGTKPWYSAFVAAWDNLRNFVTQHEALVTNGRLSADNVLSAISRAGGAYVVPLPDGNVTDHTQHVLAHAALAKSLGVIDFVLPWMAPDDTTVRWTFSDHLTAWAGVTFHLAPTKSTLWRKPLVLVPYGADDATIILQDAEGTRVASYNEYIVPEWVNVNQFGVNIRASHAAVIVHASRTRVRGYMHHFRSGVNVGNWRGTAIGNTGRPVANTIDVIVDHVDFGVNFYAQRSADITARGNYVRTKDSPDEPHLVYGTQATFSSIDCVVRINCWAPDTAPDPAVEGLVPPTGTMEGVPVILKANENVYLPYVICRGTNGMVEIVDEVGSTRIDTMVGIDVGTEGVNSDGTPKLSGIIYGGVSEFERGTRSLKSIGSARIQLRDQAAGSPGNLRVASLNEGGWDIDSLDISYKLDEVSEAQALITIMGSDTDIGRVRIKNRGLGGVIGMRYRTPSSGVPTKGHVLREAPIIDGASVGILADQDIEVNVAIDKSLIRATRQVDISRSPARVIHNAPISQHIRSNRLIPASSFGALASRTLADGTDICYPFTLNEPVTITAAIMNIATAVAGASIRLGIRNDFGNGVPGSLIAEFNPVSAAATGNVEVQWASPYAASLYLPAGVYWMTHRAQGGAPQVLGVAAANFLVGLSSVSALMTGALPAQTGQTGTLSNNFNDNGTNSTAGAARVLLRLA